MKNLWVASATVLFAWPAWSTTCVEQIGETFGLELVSVTIDGEEEDDLSRYEDSYVHIENVVDGGLGGGATEFIEFSTQRAVEGPDGEQLIEVYEEYYSSGEEAEE